MPFEYLDESVTSDLTIHAWAPSLEALLVDAADATTGVMVASLDSIRFTESRDVAIEAEAADLLLVRFLEEIVFHKDAGRLLLRATEVRVSSTAEGLRATAKLRGERIDPARHELGADVKAVTVHGLRVEQADAGWDATFTLDV